MSRPTTAERALEACRLYEHWAGEVRRLTDAIAAERCPKEWDGEELLMPGEDPEGSHVADAFKIQVPAGPLPDDGPRGLRLGEVAARPEVRACPSCSRLVALIAERKHARLQYGIAKRRVRQVGKVAVRELIPGGGPARG